MEIRRIASIKTAEDFRATLERLGIVLPFDDHVETGEASPMARPIVLSGRTVGNRFAILPMEGWDGTTDGKPSDLTTRRWQRFGQSGAKLIWGGEAVAVREDGRANPNQLVMKDQNLTSLESLRGALNASHCEKFGRDHDLCVGIQLTHSGRFSRPHDKRTLEPRVAYRHPLLDPKFGLTDDRAVLTDDEIRRLIDDFASAARMAQKIGFDFVDIKSCHGYLGHEFLSAIHRPEPFGGSLKNRARFLMEIIAAVRDRAPGMEVGVRLSLFDFLPFREGTNGRGEPIPFEGDSYDLAFGGDARTGLAADLTEPSALLAMLETQNVRLICATAGNPYTNPHVLRPAAFPPSDGYLPPEDPLIGVARQIEATSRLKAAHPDLIFIGSAYSYLQDWLPNVAQAVVRGGHADLVGLGRMVLSYPEMPADVLEGKPLQRKRICRTFSDCTSAPRNGLVSGCYPLDPFYKDRPERQQLPERRQASAARPS